MIELLMKYCSNYFILYYEKVKNRLISNNTVEVAFATMRAGDYIGIIEDNQIIIRKVTEVNDYLITFDGSNMHYTFNGYLVHIRPDEDFIKLANDIETYSNENKPDGIASESIPNYSYSKSAEGIKGWTGVFASQIKMYQKLPKTLGEMILGGVEVGT